MSVKTEENGPRLERRAALNSRPSEATAREKRDREARRKTRMEEAKRAERDAEGRTTKSDDMLASKTLQHARKRSVSGRLLLPHSIDGDGSTNDDDTVNRRAASSSSDGRTRHQYIRRDSTTSMASTTSMTSTRSKRRFGKAKTAPAHWVPDTERMVCMRCKQAFNKRRRRHHCRRCGEIFCASCTQFEPLGDSSKKLRVCVPCVLIISTEIGGGNADMYTIDDEEEKSFTMVHRSGSADVLRSESIASSFDDVKVTDEEVVARLWREIDEERAAEDAARQAAVDLQVKKIEREKAVEYNSAVAAMEEQKEALIQAEMDKIAGEKITEIEAERERMEEELQRLKAETRQQAEEALEVRLSEQKEILEEEKRKEVEDERRRMEKKMAEEVEEARRTAAEQKRQEKFHEVEKEKEKMAAELAQMEADMWKRVEEETMARVEQDLEARVAARLATEKKKWEAGEESSDSYDPTQDIVPECPAPFMPELVAPKLDLVAVTRTPELDEDTTIVLHPARDVLFSRPSGIDENVAVTCTNYTDGVIAFKIMVTAINDFEFSPNVGLIPSLHTLTINAQMKSHVENIGEECEVRAMVVTVPLQEMHLLITEELAEQDPAALRAAINTAPPHACTKNIMWIQWKD